MLTYSFSTSSTSNGLLNLPRFMSELSSSPLSVSVVGLDTVGIIATLTLSASPSVDDVTLMDSLVASHDGSPDSEVVDPTLVDIIHQVPPPPFANKILPDGRSIFKRKHGVVSQEIPPGATIDTIFTIPYAECKINEVEVVGSRVGDHVNFAVLDTINGDVSGFPSVTLNQFGFNVNVTNDFYRESSNYDADLFFGLQLFMSYTNNGDSPVTPRFNILLHEVK